MSEAPTKRKRGLPGEPVPWWVRFILAGMALVFALTFVLALRIDPYKDGPQKMGTHQQLGLAPCSFLEVTGYPCPSCGLSTSFAYTVRGDLGNGARANWVGVLMAVLGMLAIPWAIASVIAGKAVFIRSLDGALIRVVIVVFVLLFVRWGIVLIWP